MSTTNYPSGSKLNPISVEIYHQDLNNHNWHGGWVGTSDNPTYYDRQNEERTCNGSHSAPYDADVYDELLDGEMWIGGWVLEEDEGGTPHELPTYITAESTTYPEEDEDGNVFGNEDYPIPIAVYEEMCELDIWTGGWVIYPNGTTEEVPENDGGGSGSGSGCGCGDGCDVTGCGCGCGEDEGGSGCGSSTLDRLPLTAGSETFGFFENNTNFHLRISWGSGVFSATEPQPSVDCTEEGTSIISSTDSGGNMSVTWYAPYIVRISGEFDETHITFTQFYNIPESYHH
jgi:hypothetical protein